MNMIAYCGLVCSECPALLATKNDDDMAREKTAALWVEKFGLQLKPGDINCEGCLTEGKRLIGHCRTCAIRQCALAKGVEHCASCAHQPCDKLSKFHSYAPVAKASFEALKARL